MLETLCMPSMHDTLFWYISAGYVLCYTLEPNFRRENNSAGAVPSLIPYCYLYLLQELWEYFYGSLFLFFPYC